MNDWLDIGPLDAIPPRGARVVKTRDGCVAVFRTGDDRVYALDNACPHRGGPLAEGIVHGTSVTCPLHAWVFDLETGLAKGADSGAVVTHPTEIVDGRIRLDLSRLASRKAA